MIRINLLTVERERTKKRGAGRSSPAAQRVTIGATLILIATVLGRLVVLVAAPAVRADRRDIARAEAETQQLRAVLAQVQKFETRKAQLSSASALIEQLRKGQSAPVHVLDEISKSLPDRLWLTEMKQAGTDFTIAGMTTSMTALSDFIANLEATKWFKRPVEIVDSQVQTDAKAGDLVRFSVKAALNDPEAPPPVRRRRSGTGQEVGNERVGIAGSAKG